MWSCFLDSVTSLAAEFNMYCRRWILYLGRPYKSALQLSYLEVTKACEKVLAVSILRNCLIFEIKLIEWKANLHICSICLSKLRLDMPCLISGPEVSTSFLPTVQRRCPSGAVDILYCKRGTLRNPASQGTTSWSFTTNGYKLLSFC